ncbi:immunoglobulin superfamily DCC subclass member 4 isoform X2 [Bombina bombina]|uniref:immunoglobulin superfamily DCC subclass member 4 isoform X2 n=1 Tax=Bombina bombina TaxID=8345 RepID=UPI00235A4939|nr:immunoglobulin superfamily DCC subclass member 4 isoform X2 [Bombina bombina]
MALGRLSLLWGLHWAGCVLVVAAGHNISLDFDCHSKPIQAILLPGEGAIFHCDLDSSDGPFNVTWMKDGEQLDSEGPLTVLPNGSLVLSQNDIDSIEGNYSCTSQTTFGTIMGRTGTVRLANLPPFYQQPDSQSVVQNSLAVFECGISGSPPPEITWQKDREPLPTNPRFLTLPYGILQISKVQEKDSGLYRCVATNTLSTRYSNEAKLSVLQGSEPLADDLIITRTPHNLTVEIGQKALMECKAEGDVDPLVSWIRQDGKPISSDITLLGEANLLIPQAQPYHAGIYVCRANKPLSRHFVTASAHLRVLAHPVIAHPPETITRARAGTARFVCRAEGDPEPSISWLKNGHILSSNGRVRIQTKGSLVITQIALEDAGYYQCVAENDLGSSCAIAKLYVTVQDGLPGPPQAVRAQAVSGKMVTVNWEQPESNWERVIGFSLHYTKNGDNMEYQFAVNNDTTELHVKDLEPGTSYTFYVVAYSQQGASRTSQPVEVKTWDEVPAAAPILSLSSESASDLHIKWHPLPPELSNGNIIEYRIEYAAQMGGVIYTVEIGGNETQVILSSLLPSMIYKARISASTTAGYGAFSDWVQHRTLDKDNQTQVTLSPIQLKVSARTDSLSLSWQLPPSELPSGFRLFYRTACPATIMAVSCPQRGDNWDVGPIKLKKKRRQYEITHLVPGQLYQVKLVAFYKNQEGQTAFWEGRTKPIPSIPPDLHSQRILLHPPSHIEAVSNSSTSVLVQWRRPAFITGKIVNYTVRCAPWATKNTSLVTYYSSATEEILVRGLRPYTRYEFAVQSNGVGIDGPFSNTVEKMTHPDRPASPPADLVLHPVSQTSVQVHWRPPVESNGIIVQYLIMYSTNISYPDEMWTLLTREGNVFSIEVHGLQSGTKYFFKMGAKTVSGWGPYSAVKEVETLPPRLPDVLDMNSVTGIIVGVCLCLLCLLLCMCASFQQGKQREVGADLGSRSNRGPSSYQRARQGSCSQSHCQDSHELETLMPLRHEDIPTLPVPEVTDLIGGHVTATQSEDKNQLKLKPSWNGSITQNWANHITSYAETISGDPSTAANGSTNPFPIGGLRMTLQELTYEPIKLDVARGHKNSSHNQVEADVIVHSDFSASERSGRCAGLESEEEEEELSLDQNIVQTVSQTSVPSPVSLPAATDCETHGSSEQLDVPILKEIKTDDRVTKNHPLVNGFHRSLDSQEPSENMGTGFPVVEGDLQHEEGSPVNKDQHDITASNKLVPLHSTNPARLYSEP